MKGNESKASGKDIVPPCSVEVYGTWSSYIFNEETGEWEEDTEPDPILTLIEAEMIRQIDDTKRLINCAVAADTILNGKEGKGQ